METLEEDLPPARLVAMSSRAAASVSAFARYASTAPAASGASG
ncbi:hypothetical protein [Actinacidiphila soli]|nr:hypothetical protein [Actinacidiphila soli]